MKIAVTDHAVSRFRDRVQGAENLEDESVREAIREKVVQGHKEGLVRDHPTERERRIIPFKAGASMLYLSVGPNKTSYPADIAVIGVLYDKELGGKVDLGVTLEQAIPALKNIQVAPPKPPKYIVLIGPQPDTVEQYPVKDDEELEALLARRRPSPEEVYVYEHQPVEIRAQYVVQRKPPK
jgi:hypothetical protein